MWNESYYTDRIFMELADSDAMWGPFLFLRPKTTEYLSVGRTLAASVLLGVPQGLAANLGLRWASCVNGDGGVPVYTVPVTLTLALALLLHLTIGRAWNRRVDRLERAKAWVEAAQRGARSHR